MFLWLKVIVILHWQHGRWLQPIPHPTSLSLRSGQPVWADCSPTTMLLLLWNEGGPHWSTLHRGIHCWWLPETVQSPSVHLYHKKHFPTWRSTVFTLRILSQRNGANENCWQQHLCITGSFFWRHTLLLIFFKGQFWMLSATIIPVTSIVMGCVSGRITLVNKALTDYTYRLLLCLDPAPAEYETDTVEIFGFPWVTETALVESAKLLFGLFR